MNIAQELTEAMQDHYERTNTVVTRVRIHETLWNKIKEEWEGCLTEDTEQNTLTFNGADVTLVSSKTDPMEVLRWSLQ